jgi:hypothetical protein
MSIITTVKKCVLDVISGASGRQSNSTKTINNSKSNITQLGEITIAQATSSEAHDYDHQQHQLIVKTIYINNHPMTALFDTGASHTFININTVKKYMMRTSKLDDVCIKLANGDINEAKNQIKSASIIYNKKRILCNLIVLNSMNDKYDIVLGINAIRQLGISIDRIIQSRLPATKSKFAQSLINSIDIDNDFNDDTDQHIVNIVDDETNDIYIDHISKDDKIFTFHNLELKYNPEFEFNHVSTEHVNNPLQSLTPRQLSLIMKFKDVFPDKPPQQLPPKRNIQHDIKLIDEKKTHMQQVYRCSKNELEQLRKYIDEMIEAGWIRHSTSPHAAPVVFVKKPDGSMRVCVDYRKINANTIPDATIMPNIKESFDRLEGMKFFSKIDFSSGFHQIRMNDESISKTAFTTRYGHFEYTVMPMGLKNAPATFTKLMNSLFQNESDNGILIYLDDILIYSRTIEEHYRLLDKVFTILRNNQLYIKFKKCQFFVNEIDFLGHTITSEGRRPQQAKIDKAIAFPPPTTKKQIQSFLGITNHFRDHIKNYSHVAAPMTDLLSDSLKFNWTDKQQQSFDKLKQLLAEATTLRPSNSDLPFIIHTDASNVAIGASLEQRIDDKLSPVPICFMSSKLNTHEINYPTHEKEQLAIVRALQHFRPYIEGCKIILYTDNKSLEYLKSQKSMSQRQIRWLLEIERHNLIIKYIKGNKNTVADALSRRPDYLINSTTLMLKHNDLYADIIQAQKYDELCNQIKKNDHSNNKNRLKLHDENGVIMQATRIYVPNQRRIITEILQQFHDLRCHIGTDKTTHSIKLQYYWKNMDDDIQKYIKECVKCMQIKPILTKTQGLLQSHKIPNRPWQVISIDFVTGLPLSHNSNDCIAVIVDVFSKMTHILPMRTNYSTEQFAELFNREVIRHHLFPETIISDRDKYFTSKFWESLMKMTGTNLIRSSAYHPQTDGLTEKTNQTIENMLRSIVNDKNDDWERKLTWVEITINNTINASTQYTPYQLNLTYRPQLPYEHTYNESTLSDNAMKTHNHIVETLEKCKQNLNKAQQQQQLHANKKRIHIEFNVGDKVMLSTKNLKMQLGVRKLSARYYGPFTIIAKNNEVNYKLDLPPRWKVHNNIHVDRLKRYISESDKFPNRNQIVEIPPAIVTEEGQIEYEIDEILDHKFDEHNRPTKYLIKWKGYGIEDATWETADNLNNAQMAVYEYHKRIDNLKKQQLINRSTTTRVTRAANKARQQIENSNTETLSMGQLLAVGRCNQTDYCFSSKLEPKDSLISNQ